MVTIKKSKKLHAIALSVLLGLGVLFLVIGVKDSNTKKSPSAPQKTNIHTESKEKTSTIKETQNSTPENPILAEAKTSPTPTTPASGSNTSQNISSPTPIQSGPTQAPSNNQVTLSINGGSGFTVSVSQGANQCDVLSKALEQGKISSLNMRYDTGMETYGIYQINGVGKENSVFWVYKVNGQSPTQGCSYIQANNGDTIEWSYVGS